MTLSVSKGPQVASVPAVTGDDQQTATQLLQQDGFNVSVVQQDVTDPQQDGLVLAQEPTGGKAEQGSTVTITVGHLVTAPTATATTTTTTTTATTTTPGATTSPGAVTPITPGPTTDHPGPTTTGLDHDHRGRPPPRARPPPVRPRRLDHHPRRHDDRDGHDDTAAGSAAVAGRALSRRIAVLSGGRSSEHEISLASARSVAAALAAGGAEVVSIDIDRGGAWALGAGGEAPSGLDLAVRLPGTSVAAALGAVDVVFPVLHGPFGEDGTVQGLLELAGVPYVGAGVTASALAMDKDLFKSVLRDHGIPVTRNVTLRAGDAPASPFAYPMFVKPARLGSSVGISKAHDDAELAAAVALAFEHDEKVLVEEFVEGIEIEVGVLGNRDPIASVCGEIAVTNNEWYDYEAKYEAGEMELIVPARVSPEQSERARELAVRAFTATECEGMARVDMFVRSADGEVLVNELNTIPGFTQTSVYASLFEASGINYGALLERLVDLALDRHERRGRLRF